MKNISQVLKNFQWRNILNWMKVHKVKSFFILIILAAVLLWIFLNVSDYINDRALNLDGRKLLLQKDGEAYWEEWQNGKGIKHLISIPYGRVYEGIIWNDNEIVLGAKEGNSSVITQYSYYSYDIKNNSLEKIISLPHGEKMIKMDDNTLALIWRTQDNIKSVLININDRRAGKERDMFAINNRGRYFSGSNQEYEIDYGENNYFIKENNQNIKFLSRVNDSILYYFVTCNLNSDYDCHVGRETQVYGGFLNLNNNLITGFDSTVYFDFSCHGIDEIFFPCTSIGNFYIKTWDDNGKEKMLTTIRNWEILGHGNISIDNDKILPNGSFMVYTKSRVDVANVSTQFILDLQTGKRRIMEKGVTILDAK